MRDCEKVKLIMHIEGKLPRLALSLLDQDQLDAMIFVMTNAPPDFAIRKVSTEPMELREKFKENYEALRKTDSVPDIAEMWDTEGIEGIVALAAEKGFVKFEDIMNAKKAIYPAFSHTFRFQSSVISWFLLLGRDSRRPSVFQFAGLSWSLLLGRDHWSLLLGRDDICKNKKEGFQGWQGGEQGNGAISRDSPQQP